MPDTDGTIVLTSHDEKIIPFSDTKSIDEDIFFDAPGSRHSSSEGTVYSIQLIHCKSTRVSKRDLALVGSPVEKIVDLIRIPPKQTYYDATKAVLALIKKRFHIDILTLGWGYAVVARYRTRPGNTKGDLQIKLDSENWEDSRDFLNSDGVESVSFDAYFADTAATLEKHRQKQLKGQTKGKRPFSFLN